MSPSADSPAEPPRWVLAFLVTWIVGTGALLWCLKPIDVATLSLCRANADRPIHGPNPISQTRIQTR